MVKIPKKLELLVAAASLVFTTAFPSTAMTSQNHHLLLSQAQLCPHSAIKEGRRIIQDLKPILTDSLGYHALALYYLKIHDGVNFGLNYSLANSSLGEAEPHSNSLIELQKKESCINEPLASEVSNLSLMLLGITGYQNQIEEMLKKKFLNQMKQVIVSNFEFPKLEYRYSPFLYR